MDNRVKIVVGGAVVLLLLVILAIFFFLSNVTKKSTTTNTELNTLNNLPTLSASGTPTAPNTSTPTTGGSLKSFNGFGFSLKYPNAWGVLTCTNSSNFEFDPTSSAPTSILCDEAVKPVTIIVANNLNCQGTAVNLGNLTVVKSKTTDAENYTSYRWCVPLGNSKALDITHRVDPNGSRATSTQDYSSQVEEIIKTITTTPQGS